MSRLRDNSILNIRKKITRIHDSISTSYHEAGHAVYALLCGMMVSSVSIFENVKNKRIEGLCYYHLPEIKDICDNELLLYIANAEIGVRYAGLTSEKYFFKSICGSDKFPKFLKDSSFYDTLMAAQAIKKFNVVSPGKKRYEYKKRKINQVSKSLELYWSDVTLLAHQLFSKKKLSYLDIKNLFIKKSTNKNFWKEQFKKISYIFQDDCSIDEKQLKIILCA